jgi:hypothetical protein
MPGVCVRIWLDTCLLALLACLIAGQPGLVSVQQEAACSWARVAELSMDARAYNTRALHGQVMGPAAEPGREQNVQQAV